MSRILHDAFEGAEGTQLAALIEESTPHTAELDTTVGAALSGAVQTASSITGSLATNPGAQQPFQSVGNTT